MTGEIDLLKRLYVDFNARDIDGVLTVVTDDVEWANGMDGGHVHGHEGIREYWARQGSVVDPHVEPVGFRQDEDGAIVAEVLQTILDLEGNPLEGQTHGLKDKTVDHIFRFRDGKVARFDVRDRPDDAA